MEKAEAAAADGDPQLEADFAIMSLELTRLIRSVIEALGGERGPAC